MYVGYLNLPKRLSMTTYRTGYNYPSNTMYPYTTCICTVLTTTCRASLRIWTSNSWSTASLATCAWSSHLHCIYSIMPMLINLVGCIILSRRRTSHFQISIMILQPYEDDWYLILCMSEWGTRWRGSREVRGNGRSNLHAMEHEWVSDATCQNIGRLHSRDDRFWRELIALEVC